MDYPPINDYGLIGDTVSAALVNRAGGIDWLCWPRFDSPPLFLSLLDRGRGGQCTIDAASPGGSEPAALLPLSRRYLPGSNVLETVLAEGASPYAASLKITDFMPIRSKAVGEPPLLGPVDLGGCNAQADGRVVRLLEAGARALEVRVTVRPTFDYAQNPAPAAISHYESERAAAFTSEDGVSSIHVEGSAALTLRREAGALEMNVRLRAGEKAWVVLTEGRPGRLALLDHLPAVEALLRSTLSYWQPWSERCTYQGPFREAVQRSILCLKALTFSPTGAIVAAPTLGLPETLGGSRNYDYRYTWLRDASFTVRAFLNCGYQQEARAFLAFLGKYDRSEGRSLPVLLCPQGTDVSEERTLGHLDGYRRSRPVRAGNAAGSQKQHDIYGEVLNALYTFWQMTGEMPPAGPDGKRLGEIVRHLAEAVENLWQTKDRGLWEARDGEHHFFHSKAMCWVAMDRASKLAAEALHWPEEAAHWASVARTIREDYLTKGWHPKRQAYTRDYKSAELDAAVLRLPFFEALDANDPRLATTLDTIRRELGAPEARDLIYRYRAKDGFAGQEGTFISCAFWVASCDGMIGRMEQATALFGKLLVRSNDLGLFAEEIDPRDGSALGNFPQAFTHMSIVNGAVRLEQLAPSTAQGPDGQHSEQAAQHSQASGD